MPIDRLAKLKGDACIPVKGAHFAVAELLGAQGADLAESFSYGSLCVCRLCPADYHRYHYPADGKEVCHWRLGNRWHSVNPLALARNIRAFTTNVREVTIFDPMFYLPPSSKSALASLPSPDSH